VKYSTAFLLLWPTAPFAPPCPASSLCNSFHMCGCDNISGFCFMGMDLTSTLGHAQASFWAWPMHAAMFVLHISCYQFAFVVFKDSFDCQFLGSLGLH